MQMSNIDPDLLRLLELLVPYPQAVVVRTALTCDTKNPWGQPFAGFDFAGFGGWLS